VRSRTYGVDARLKVGDEKRSAKSLLRSIEGWIHPTTIFQTFNLLLLYLNVKALGAQNILNTPGSSQPY
jgi:hypothetical protein